MSIGIKESVLRLDQRDLHVLMAHSGLAGDRGSSLHPHGTSGYSPGNSRSGTSFLSQSYGASHGSTFSPYGHARSPLLAHAYNQHQQQLGQGQGPHFTRPSMLKRDASAGSLMAPGTPTLDDGGSPAGSAQNSLKFPSMQGMQPEAVGCFANVALSVLAGVLCETTPETVRKILSCCFM